MPKTDVQTKLIELVFSLAVDLQSLKERVTALENKGKTQPMRQTIITRRTANYRYSARNSSGGTKIIMPEIDGASIDENHKAAAKLLAQKLGWKGEFVGGCFDGVDTYVFVQRDDESGVITV